MRFENCCSSSAPSMFSGFPRKESACNVGDLGSIPGLGRCPGEGNSYTLQYCCLENCMDRALVGYNPWGHRFKYDWVTFTSVHFIMHTTTWDILCTRIYNCPEVNLKRFVRASLGLLEPISMCVEGLLTDKQFWGIPTGCPTVQIILALLTWRQHQIP